MPTVKVDVRKRGAWISPLLFGHNLEHTRSCVWQGLAAQMLKNRKFAGKPDRAGQALDWYAIGPESTWFYVDPDAERAYTRHAGPKDQRRYNEVQSQSIEAFVAGGPSGIGQHGLALFADRRYEARIVMRSPRRMRVRVRFAGHDPKKTLFEKTLVVAPGGWRKFAFKFAPRATDEHGRIEITFNGPGRLVIGAASLMPADHFHGMRRDVVELLKEIGTAVLRWPGGNFAGDYRWLDGFLDVDQRGPLASFMEIETLPHTRGMDTHEIGTDEFIALCRELGAEPFITINLAWDPPEAAASWVEYCNGSPRTKWGGLRARRGHREPYGVKFWSLGNELGYTHMEGPNAPAAYAKKASACAKAMRRVDRSIVLACSGFWWHDAWFTDCLKPLSPQLDLISHHWYTKPVPTKCAGPGSDAQFRKIVAKPAFIMDDMRKVREKMDRFTVGKKRIGISFDEWNIWYAWNRKPGVVDGMHTAAMLNILCREAAAIGVPVGCYFEPVNEGAILVDPRGSRLTPVGQVFRLFKPHQGRTLLDVPAPGGGVDAAASLDERTGEVVVTLANLNPDRDREVTLSFAGVPAGNLVTITLLTSKDRLPASRFAEKRSVMKAWKGGRLVVSLPRHTVARVSLATGVAGR